MKTTIFRLTYTGLMLAAILALGAVAGLAQDPCNDAAGQTAMQDEFDGLYKTYVAANKVNPNDPTTVDALRKVITSGKGFLEKYPGCATTKERSDWLAGKIPGWEQSIPGRLTAGDKAKMTKDFDASLQATNTTDAAAKAKAYGDAFSIGQQILNKYPDDYRMVEIVLATMGGDEALIRNNYKYADDALRYAKMALADMTANKSFALNGQGQSLYGLSLGDPKTNKIVYDFSFKDRNAAMGWMNLYVGTILYNNKKDKAGALPYLYQASKLVPDSPVSYALVGDYYFDQLGPEVQEINALIKTVQGEPDVEKVKAFNEEIKAKVAISNGVAERAMDAYARAYTISTKADYKANMKTTIGQVFKVRFPTPPMTVDQWIAGTVTKPFVDPTTPVAPIADPEPVKTTTGTGTGVGAANGTGVGAANGTGVGGANGTGIGGANGTGVGGAKSTTTPPKTQTPAKPAGTTPAKKPGGVSAKKPVVKKRGA